jgi:hypothetical protein
MHKDRIKARRVDMSDVNWIMEVSKNNSNKNCNHVILTNIMQFSNYCFEFNSSCLLHISDILGSSSGILYALYGMFFMHLCKQSSRLEEVLDTDIDIEHIKLQP